MRKVQSLGWPLGHELRTQLSWSTRACEKLVSCPSFTCSWFAEALSKRAASARYRYRMYINIDHTTELLVDLSQEHANMVRLSFPFHTLEILSFIFIGFLLSASHRNRCLEGGPGSWLLPYD